MANKMYNNSFDTRKLQVEEDDDWDTDADFVNEDNIDNSKQQTQKQATTNYRASVIGKDLLKNAAPVDKTPSTPPSGRHINTAPSTYTPPGVFVSKKPAAPSSTINKPVASTPAPAVTTSASKPVSSVASKFSQPAQTTTAPPVKSTPVVSKFSQPSAPVAAAPPVKSTPTPVASKFSQPPAPVASPVKKPPPAPKRVQEPVYEEPVYEEPVQEQYYEEPAQEQYYEEPAQEQYYEEPAQEQQYYEEQQPADDQQYYEEQPAQDAQDYQQYPQAQALYDYVGEQEGDLSFYAGDIIYVYDSSDASGWYQGQLDNGTYGSFPSTFVQLL